MEYVLKKIKNRSGQLDLQSNAFACLKVWLGRDGHFNKCVTLGTTYTLAIIVFKKMAKFGGCNSYSGKYVPR